MTHLVANAGPLGFDRALLRFIMLFTLHFIVVGKAQGTIIVVFILGNLDANITI